MGRRTHGWRPPLAGIAVAALVVSGLTATAATAQQTADRADGTVQVQQRVLTELAEDGTTTFWVRFDARPDLSAFADITDRDARGTAVYDALTTAAETAQADVRAELDAAGLGYVSHWATNAILVEDAGEDVLDGLVRTPGIEGVYASFDYAPPVTRPAAQGRGLHAVEWGVRDIGADDVWAQGITGEGIVVANIDSGVQWDHPALIDRYRGWDGSTADHDHNWFDGTEDRPAPWDWDGHGTHTMGTMVGDDGGSNQIGVAPGARWIAASTDMSDERTIAAAEWVLAPTEVGGANPDPTMRPHVVNNSWGSELPSDDPFMEDVIEAWHAAGIFSVFSNGNEGPSCATSATPGSRAVSYSVGSYDAAHSASGFSARGPGQDGEVKPNISAPGSSIRSSYPGNQYGSISGTSMAAPHVSGAVALLWSADADARGDVEGTRALLDGTAIDTVNTQCGGTAEKNNVFGEGRLDAAQLVLGRGTVPERVQRIWGADRYATAAEIAAEFPDGTDTVYVANGTEAALGVDALAAGAAGAAGVLGATPDDPADGVPAPILLVRADQVPAATQGALTALDPGLIVILGGTAVVSEGVEDALASSGADVRRVAGEDRYETAALVAAEHGPGGTAYVASGQGSPVGGMALADALSAASVAGSQGAPVLLTRSESLPDVTGQVLAGLGVTSIVVVGGPAVVSEDVVAALGAIAPTVRVHGPDRYATAAALTAGYGTDGDRLYVASGTSFPDALAGASLTGSQGAPVLLTRSGSLPEATSTEILRLSPQGVTVFGGSGAVSTTVETDLQTLLDQTSTD